jgi:hypothetical protein
MAKCRPNFSCFALRFQQQQQPERSWNKVIPDQKIQTVSIRL